MARYNKRRLLNHDELYRRHREIIGQVAKETGLPYNTVLKVMTRFFSVFETLADAHCNFRIYGFKFVFRRTNYRANRQKYYQQTITNTFQRYGNDSPTTRFQQR